MSSTNTDGQVSTGISTDTTGGTTDTQTSTDGTTFSIA